MEPNSPQTSMPSTDDNTGLDEELTDTSWQINAITFSDDNPYHTTISINGTSAQTLLDTASPISVIPYELVDAAGFAEHVPMRRHPTVHTLPAQPYCNPRKSQTPNRSTWHGTPLYPDARQARDARQTPQMSDRARQPTAVWPKS